MSFAAVLPCWFDDGFRERDLRRRRRLFFGCSCCELGLGCALDVFSLVVDCFFRRFLLEFRRLRDRLELLLDGGFCSSSAMLTPLMERGANRYGNCAHREQDAQFLCHVVKD